jgi:hypothetical protein
MNNLRIEPQFEPIQSVPEQVEVLSHNSIDIISSDEHKIQPFVEESNTSKKSKTKKLNLKNLNPKTSKKQCPMGQRRHPKTKRCRKRCPTGKRRSNSTHKCVKNRK